MLHFLSVQCYAYWNAILITLAHVCVCEVFRIFFPTLLVFKFSINAKYLAYFNTLNHLWLSIAIINTIFINNVRPVTLDASFQHLLLQL